MKKDIVTELDEITSRFKNGEIDLLWHEYETICNATRLIENLRDLIIQIKFQEWSNIGFSIGDFIEIQIEKQLDN